MSGITHYQSQAAGASHTSRLRTALIVALVVAAFACAAMLALAVGDTGTPAGDGARPAAVSGSAISPPGIRYDGGPEEGSWRVTAPNPGRPDGGPEEGTRGPGH